MSRRELEEREERKTQENACGKASMRYAQKESFSEHTDTDSTIFSLCSTLCFFAFFCVSAHSMITHSRTTSFFLRDSVSFLSHTHTPLTHLVPTVSCQILPPTVASFLSVRLCFSAFSCVSLHSLITQFTFLLCESVSLTHHPHTVYLPSRAR